MGQLAPSCQAPLTGNGTAEGYVFVDDVTQFQVGATANIRSTTAQKEVVIESLVRDGRRYRIGLRDVRRATGRSDMSAFLVAEGARLFQVISVVGNALGVTLDALGKIPVQYLPPESLPEVFLVADEAERLALDAQEGDEAIQDDDETYWVYDGTEWRLRTAAGLVYVDDLGDLPAAVNDVITLVDNATYLFTRDLDLLGARLVGGQNTVIMGTSSENCRLKSTGLTGAPLITSQWSLPMRFISLEAEEVLDLDAAGNPDQALDWFGVNFVNCQTVGRIANYNNFIMADSAFLSSAGLVFDGTIGTIGLSQCLFVGRASSTILTVASTAVVSRRFRVIYSSLSVPATGKGVELVAGASVGVESFILDTVNFSNAGTYVVGAAATDNVSLFVNCIGISNTASITQYGMTGNLTSTTFSGTGVFTKVLGVTTTGPYSARFTLTDNRATYAGARSGFFKVTAVATVDAQANREIAFRIAVDGATIALTETSTNTEGVGRSAPVTFQGIVFLSANTYIEMWVANKTSASSVVVSSLNVIIERLS